MRQLDAYCEVCDEATAHDVRDEGSCACTVCGHIQQLMSPRDDAEASPS